MSDLTPGFAHLDQDFFVCHDRQQQTSAKILLGSCVFLITMMRPTMSLQQLRTLLLFLILLSLICVAQGAIGSDGLCPLFVFVPFTYSRCAGSQEVVDV